MANLVYTPDEDIKVHEEGAIQLICKAFQSHESGLPEWLKNSADAYARENAPETKRVIVVIFDHGRKRVNPSISCLDFCGMTSASIEENFRIWADPEAAQRGGTGVPVQGGHGNGGKCYMTQMFNNYAMIKTVKNGKGCLYGTSAGSIRFGYVPNREEGRDFPVPDLTAELEKSLKPLRCSIGAFPQAVAKAISMANGFTLVTGVGPKGYEDRIPTRQLIETLQDHPQMTRTLDLCRTYVMVNGETFNGGRPLVLPEIKPIPGAEKPRVFPIPLVLKDPTSGEEISTTEKGSLPQGSLILRSSDVSMRWSRKGRHNIVFKAQSGYIGYVPVSEMDVQSTYRDRIYGECDLEALETYKQNERARLANSPLSRAVEYFATERIQAYAEEFESRDKRQYDQEEKNTLSAMNEALDRWKNHLLNEIISGLWGSSEDGGGTREPQTPLPTGKPTRLELTLTHQRAGIGVAFRPTLKFFDRTGQRIRSVPFRWVSEDNNIAMVDEDLTIINTFSYGKTSIYAETLEGRLYSDKLPLEVVRIIEINISPSQVELSTGSRQKLDAVCSLANGEETNDVYLVWTESNSRVARVSSSGLVFGFEPGQTEVVAGDDKSLAKTPSIIKVVAGSSSGKGFPKILISGVQPDPETGELVSFSSDYPPVWQRPQDVNRNIWWVNGSAPLAKMYLDTNRGYGYGSTEWRMYLIERYIEIMTQIALVYGPKEEESLSIGDWILKWGERVVEIQPAVASSLAVFVATGELPRVEE